MTESYIHRHNDEIIAVMFLAFFAFSLICVLVLTDNIPILLLSILIAFTFLVRISFRLKHPNASGSDSWWHLHEMEVLSQHRRTPQKLDGYSLETTYDTPSLIHTIISKFPKETRDKDFLFGPISDSIYVFVIFVFAYFLTNNVNLAFFSGIIFAFTPILMRPDARTFFFSPRPWAELFTSVSLMFGVLMYAIDIRFLLLSILFGAFAFYTSKFAPQALTFFCIGLALIDWHFILIPILSMGMAILISKGRYIKVLKGHIKHTNFYRTTIAKTHTCCTEVTGIRDIFKNPKSVLHNPTFLSFLFLPFFPFLTFLSIFSHHILADPMIITLFAWSMTAFTLTTLISLKKLRFLGEAERYMNYAVFPVCVLIPILMGTNIVFWILAGLIVFSSVILIRENFRTAERYYLTNKQDEIDIFSHLNSLPRKRIFCIPFNISPKITYHTYHETVYWDGNLPGDDFGKKQWNEMFNTFPYPKDSLAHFCQEYGADLLLFSMNRMDDRSVSDYDLTDFEREFQNGSYEIYSYSP